MHESINKKAVSVFLESEIKEISGRWASFEISRRALDRSIKEKEITVNASIREKANEVKKLLEGRNDQKKKEFMDALPQEDKDAFNAVNELENQKKTLENVIKQIEPTVDFLEEAKAFKAEVDREIVVEDGIKSVSVGEKLKEASKTEGKKVA